MPPNHFYIKIVFYTLFSFQRFMIYFMSIIEIDNLFSYQKMILSTPFYKIMYHLPISIIITSVSALGFSTDISSLL